MSAVAWEVRFCPDCSRAFDVEAGKRASELCDECRRVRKNEHTRQHRVRTYQRKPVRVPARLRPPDPWMEERRRQGFSYAQIAAEAGIPVTTLQRRFRGSR